MIQQIYPTTPHSYAFELNKDMQLATAHYIDHEGAGKCQRVHGHTYTINITIAGDHLNDTGFLVDFKQLKQLVHDRFDHQLLNEDPLFHNVLPSTENVAKIVYMIIEDLLKTMANAPTCIQVFVRETPTSYVVYRPKRAHHE
ncbi:MULTISPECIES: 6-carboxytetrahydropterin synthase QueD [Bacillaceae]|uniref:6-carboxy-5,6,7,8-tetrahydropterin synthase n=1 Tax=Alkalicoccobacillus plakortidis TaxID=444060 RepID=A0A9D5HZ22_9BACI|nr:MULTISPECIES: 6-carboxytetrahydropterin synthase QueD [Bacillaceae]KQL51759.1 6-carboxy-5,6,7,8-tetrahydropterin synthase [Alkalicoccobacillus plakortidis]